MEYKHFTCPCCGKEVDIQLSEYSSNFNFNYSILINSREEFFDLVEMCPECGYTQLFDNGVSDEMREFLRSDIYQNIRNNNDIELGLKKWLLLAILCESDENYTEAAIAYTKAYDYLELKKMPLDPRLIEKAASCFFSAAGEHASFVDAILAVDSLRRDGEIEKARHFLETISQTFSGEIVDELVWKENLWLKLNEREKRYLEI